MRKSVFSLVAAPVLAALAIAGGPGAASAAERPSARSGIVATFGAQPWGTTTFKALITDPTQIARARSNYAGTNPFPTFPTGVIDYSGPAENTGWSWHLRDVQIVDQAAEACDGTPFDVEAHAITVANFCPWPARVVAIQEVG
jgi:hypothetical protein